MKIKVTISCSGLSFSFAEGQVVDAGIAAAVIITGIGPGCAVVVIQRTV